MTPSRVRTNLGEPSHQALHIVKTRERVEIRGLKGSIGVLLRLDQRSDASE
jgi:hypothetical protein